MKGKNKLINKIKLLLKRAKAKLANALKGKGYYVTLQKEKIYISVGLS